EVEDAVKFALDSGYRSIDTAAIYRNEEGVGKAIKNNGIPREEIFLTTKVWNSDQGYEETLMAFENSRKLLRTNYMDLYLIHWPVEGKYKQTWRALEKLYSDGKVKAIGVSNFMVSHLQEILATCEVVPMVNQIEYHPYLQQREVHQLCQQHKIQLEAWSPLMKGEILKVPEVLAIAEKYGKTPVQVVLRWDLQHGVVTIPKSVNADRIEDNAKIYDFELSETEMACIDALEKGQRFGPDPNNFDF
ncbi:MAG: aldo/keto reductase, partial [Cyclobacteriaceae bacterium]